MAWGLAGQDLLLGNAEASGSEGLSSVCALRSFGCTVVCASQLVRTWLFKQVFIAGY